MKEIKRISAGVMFESDVLHFIDRLAAEQQRTRSFIINHVIRHFCRMRQLAIQVEAGDTPQTGRPVEVLDLIRF
jgi:hypothetical protein